MFLADPRQGRPRKAEGSVFGELQIGPLAFHVIDCSLLKELAAPGEGPQPTLIFADNTKNLDGRAFFNEEEIVAPLLAEIRAVCDALEQSYEAIFVKRREQGRHGAAARRSGNWLGPKMYS